MPATAPVVEYRPTSAAHDHRRPAMADGMIAMVRRHREGEAYPTAEALIGNLPKVLRAMSDHLLSGDSDGLGVAYRLASLIDAIEGCQGQSVLARRTH